MTVTCCVGDGYESSAAVGIVCDQSRDGHTDAVHGWFTEHVERSYLFVHRFKSRSEALNCYEEDHTVLSL